MKRHPFDLISAFFGAVFATLGVLLLARHGLEPRHLAVVGPALVIAAGVALLASVLRSSRRGEGGTPDAWPAIDYPQEGAEAPADGAPGGTPPEP